MASTYYNVKSGNTANHVICRQTTPDTTPLLHTTTPDTTPLLHTTTPDTAGSTYNVHESDHTIMNPGDHWFWSTDHSSALA